MPDAEHEVRLDEERRAISNGWGDPRALLRPTALAGWLRLARTTPERAAEVILRGAARGRPRVLVGADAWALHLVGGLSPRMWHRITATIAARRAPSGSGRDRTVPNGRQRPAE